MKGACRVMGVIDDLGGGGDIGNVATAERLVRTALERFGTLELGQNELSRR